MRPSWRVQNFVAVGWSNCKPEHYKSNFQCDWTIVSGMGAKSFVSNFTHQWDLSRSISGDEWWYMNGKMSNQANTTTNNIRKSKSITAKPANESNRGAIQYSDVIISTVASVITGVSIVYSTVCSSANQRKHQSSALLAFVRGIHRWPVNSPHKGNAENVSKWWRHHERIIDEFLPIVACTFSDLSWNCLSKPVTLFFNYVSNRNTALRPQITTFQFQCQAANKKMKRTDWCCINMAGEL